MNEAPASAQASTWASVRTVPAPTRATPSATSAAMTPTPSGMVMVISIPASEVPAKPRPRARAARGLSVRSTAITPRPAGGRWSAGPGCSTEDIGCRLACAHVWRHNGISYITSYPHAVCGERLRRSRIRVLTAKAFGQACGHSRNRQQVDEFPGGPGQELVADGRHSQTQEHAGLAGLAADRLQRKRPRQAGVGGPGLVDKRVRRGDLGYLEGGIAPPVIRDDVARFQA